MAKQPKTTGGKTTHRVGPSLPRQVSNAKSSLSGATGRSRVDAAEMAAVKPKAAAKPAKAAPKKNATKSTRDNFWK